MYQAPPLLNNGHLQTLITYFLRPNPNIKYVRERLTTPDNDFLDLDWSFVESASKRSKKLVILSHGLEGSSDAKYIRGMARYFNIQRWDALAWNNRSCSGELNLRPIFYHSGATYDLDFLMNHILQQFHYDQIALIGFSLGGNLTLKYLGEKSDEIDPRVTKAVAISVPIDLKSCQIELDRSQNAHYRFNFLKSLRAKVKSKIQRGDIDFISPKQLDKIKTFYDYDDIITGPLHGLKGADHYYQVSSSKQYLKKIAIPTLLINAQDDPFLGEECYIETTFSDFLSPLTPKSGGHVGFVTLNTKNHFWSEQMAHQFINMPD